MAFVFLPRSLANACPLHPRAWYFRRPDVFRNSLLGEFDLAFDLLGDWLPKVESGDRIE